MALTSWRSFPFFAVSQVPVPADEDGSYVFDNEVTSLTTGNDELFIGSTSGLVRILNRNFKVVRSFHATDAEDASIVHLKKVPGTSLLVTLAENLSSEPVLKVWALDRIEKKTNAPRCLCSVSVANQKKQFPATALAVLEDLSQVAVGFANGAVTVIRGDFIHDRGTKQRTVFEAEDPVTGLEVREGQNAVLFIATVGRIASLTISGKNSGQPARTVDNRGCDVGCMTLDSQTRDLVIAREDAVYTYTSSGRGQPLAFDGPKKLVKIFNGYVAIAGLPRVAQLSKSKTLRKFGVSETDDLFTSSSFTLLDTDLKFIAHTETISSQIRDIFMIWGEVFLLTLEGKLYRYQEKSLQQKLEILYQSSLYILAINLAQKSGIDKPQQNVIFRKYGDHLYSKGDYDTAMQQYLRAIDNTEPSQVIRKYLDTQRIQNLIEYLEELHEHGKANTDHTTLLLNCYAKLKDTEKLDAFVKTPGDLKFDLETAIMMCRQGGYFEQAAYLATKYGENELAMDILIEDSKRYHDALDYISRLSAGDAYRPMMRYARVLIENCPQQATKLFTDYYTGQYQPKKDVVVETVTQPQPSGGALSNLSALLPLPYMNTSAVATPPTTSEQTATVGDANLAAVDNDIPSYTIPRPRTAFSAFIAHPNEFITFLESLLSQGEVAAADRLDISTTLFELYLERGNASPDNEKKLTYHEKAKRLITLTSQQADVPSFGVDTSNVLLLSSLSKFPAGTTLVREREDLYPDIFRSFASQNDTEGAINALKRYGPKDLSLYPLALAYFTSSDEVLAKPGVKEELQNVLRRIDQENLMAPLQVVKILSQGGAVEMGMVKAYLADNIARERKEIQNSRRLIESYRIETASKKAELEELSTNPVTFQSRRCSGCGRNLDLPAVHFLCKHSFHQRCLNTNPELADGADDEAECPICKPHNDLIKASRRQQIESAEQHDLFKSALERSTDRFGTVAEFFGRGVMAAPPLAD